MSQPLSGIKVLDFTQLLPGAMCTQQLADLGAEVLKIEPLTGDGARGGRDGTTPLFVLTNRNKTSLTLNLKQPAAQKIVRELAATADILVEGFRPGVMQKFTLGYGDIQAINPRIIYASITGYGQTGKLAARAGHDINYQSYAGVLEQSALPGGRPTPGNLPVADLAGGALSTAVGILAALFDAQRSGLGRHVDIAMTDCALALSVIALAGRYTFGKMPAPGGDVLSGALPCYRTYPTQDGRYLAVGALEPKFWARFCELIARPDLLPHGWDSGDQAEATMAQIAAVIATKTLAAWTEIFEPEDACTSPVLTLDEVLANPRGEDMALKVPSGFEWDTQLASPLRMTNSETVLQRKPPSLGEQNAEILAKLGYTAVEIAAFSNDGII